MCAPSVRDRNSRLYENRCSATEQTRTSNSDNSRLSLNKLWFECVPGSPFHHQRGQMTSTVTRIRPGKHGANGGPVRNKKEEGLTQIGSWDKESPFDLDTHTHTLHEPSDNLLAECMSATHVPCGQHDLRTTSLSVHFHRCQANARFSRNTRHNEGKVGRDCCELRLTTS